MNCDGCVRACTRILTKFDTVKEVKPDLEAQKIVVVGSADDEEMLEALKKW